METTPKRGAGVCWPPDPPVNNEIMHAALEKFQGHPERLSIYFIIQFTTAQVNRVLGEAEQAMVDLPLDGCASIADCIDIVRGLKVDNGN